MGSKNTKNKNKKSNEKVKNESSTKNNSLNNNELQKNIKDPFEIISINNVKIEPTKKTNIILKKEFSSTQITALGLIKYNNQEYIVVGGYYNYANRFIEIYDPFPMELIGRNDNELHGSYISYISQLYEQNFLCSSDDLRIFTYFQENDISTNSKNIKLNIRLIQIIKTNMYCNFLKCFIFDRNLYRQHDIYEMGKDRRQKIKNPNYIGNFPIGDELIADTNKGIFYYIKKHDTEAINKLNKNNDIEKDKKDLFDIDNYLEQWKNNPYTLKQIISKDYNFDIVQVNFKYFAGVIDGYLLLYSIETCEMVTKFKVKTTSCSYKVIFMLSENLLCIGGDDTITLISINDFDVVLESLIKPNYRISEICIIPDNNIVICMKSKEYYINEEHLIHYKYYISEDKTLKTKKYSITKISSELLTDKNSNLTMEGLSNKDLVTLVEKKYIQIRKLNI